ncbi:hypothetical protein K503DRAFT_787652 [Rhizopogon vinicolor AM-OR11-026]|uniref:Uncharacterized protein n=1 Tax=Rhizopogon vinicolor AM-OR11-026 TaxID=1314800 RepID=A0A1B7MGK6_9AGAM|nr:hypothetical protein K503DRAFT_787652 [Rhizopogon vinicolor AM-OR11-026]
MPGIDLHVKSYDSDIVFMFIQLNSSNAMTKGLLMKDGMILRMEAVQVGSISNLNTSEDWLPYSIHHDDANLYRSGSPPLPATFYTHIAHGQPKYLTDLPSPVKVHVIAVQISFLSRSEGSSRLKQTGMSKFTGSSSTVTMWVSRFWEDRSKISLRREPHR